MDFSKLICDISYFGLMFLYLYIGSREMVEIYLSSENDKKEKRRIKIKMNEIIGTIILCIFIITFGIIYNKYS